MNQEFFIGWLDKAPKGYAITVRYTIWSLIIALPLIALLLVSSQRGFIGSTYELARQRTLEGILIAEPIPCLKLKMGQDERGRNQFQRVLLVGQGKKSAHPALATLEQRLGQKLSGKAIKLRGKLIYYDGVVAFELAPDKDIFEGFAKIADLAKPPILIGEVTLRGEILDPKCYLGVMRPGEGKPHRSCAIRCLAGGIPAFFKAATSNGTRQYCFVLDQHGQAINGKIAPYVADEVQICGTLEQWDNWYVIKADWEQGFTRLLPHWAKGQAIPMCH